MPKKASKTPQIDFEYWRRPQVEKVTGLSRSVIYMLIAQGRFPRGCKLGSRIVGWPAHEVRAWCAERYEQSRGAA